jgi:hypothetical protein
MFGISVKAALQNYRVKDQPFVLLGGQIGFTPLEIMSRSVSSPAIAGLEFLTGFTLFH